MDDNSKKARLIQGKVDCCYQWKTEWSMPNYECTVGEPSPHKKPICILWYENV